jgi:predicted ATPase/DNA-binding SARP family transcriptional activator
MPRKDSSRSFRLCLLGPFLLEEEAGSIRLPTRKVELLLAYLALHAEEHTREKLASLLWGDSTDKQARDSLRTALKSLRQKLGERLLLADREMVQLNPEFPLWVDAPEFVERLTDSPDSGISLYRGDLLAEFYDEWILPERERLREVYLGALLRLAQEARTRGEWIKAIELAKKVLALDAANEQAHQHLMYCYFGLGNKAAALKQYEECVRALRQELDIEPSPETTALYLEIKASGAAQKFAPSRLTNLPVPLTSFVGRGREIQQIKEILARRRFLTLVGAGGSGKTRLAIQVASDLIEEFGDGVWWVELAALSDAGLVSAAVAKAVGVREVPNQPIGETLANHLRSRRALVVLDNCEHLVEGCAQLAQGLLTACAGLKILATSREALGLAGEHVWQVPTMSLPDAHQLPLPELLARYEGIQLFIERAIAVKSDFEITTGNAFAIGQVCRRLDGIPLAIELAAARVKVLSPEEIAVRLNDLFGLLTSGSRVALPRQQTLRATIDWSHDLLTEAERTLFRRLSVFSGGSTLEAAESVCAGGGIEHGPVFDVLTHLVDKSLVAVEAPGQEGVQTRYRMLETVREYARGKLIGAGEADLARDRHLQFFARLAEQAEPMLFTEQVTWFNRLDAEIDNLRSAIEWSMQRSDAGVREMAELGLLLAGALTWFLESRARRETSELLREILSKPGAQAETIARAKGVNALGHLEWSLGNLREARSALEEALAIGRKLGDKTTMAWALAYLGAVADFQGDYAAVPPFIEEALAASPDAGFIGKNIRGVALCFLGDVPMHEGDFERAEALYEEGVSLLREVQSKNFLTYPLRRLGYVALLQGDYVKAEGLFRECLKLNQELGHQMGITACVAALAEGIAAQGDQVRALELFGAVDASLEAMNSQMFSPDQIEYERYLAAVRVGLDETTLNAAWAKGRAMTLEQAVDYALGMATLKS